MKAKYVSIFFALAFASVSCKVNDIGLYSDENPRIEFAGLVTYTFSDDEYLNAHILGGEEYSEVKFTARLIGYFLEAPRTFAVTSEPIASAFNPVFRFDNPYTFPAEQSEYAAAFRVRCPEREDVSTRKTTNTGQAYIVYDNSSAYQQFGEGRVENLACRVDVVLQIYPTDWNSAFWGSYSTSKYLLMMETFKAVHGDIQQTAGNKTRIKEAYDAYKSANGPLYGDDVASETEISFPD